MKTTAKYHFLLLFSFIFLTAFAQKTSHEISGIVTDGQSPLSNATISIKGTERGTATDSKGKYVIKTNPKDILTFSYIGMNSVEIVVEDVTRILNIALWPKFEELDEVVVTKSKRKTQKDLKIEYATNTNIISSNFGFIDKETTPFKFQTLNGNDINPVALDLVAAITGKFANILGGSWYDQSTGRREPAMFNRRTGKFVYEVDGMFMTSVPEINISAIDRIGILFGTAAARRYGNGAGGVIIINTKMAKYGASEDDGKPYDQAKLRNNTYTNDAVSPNAMRINEPVYLRDLYQCATEEEAIAVYEKHKSNFGSSYVFTLENYRFFNERFGNKTATNQIIESNQSQFDKNPLALKALAYIKQSNGDLEKANELYKEVFLLRPEYGQSYLDLANSYREVQEYTKAVSLYTRYNHLIGSDLVQRDSSQFFDIFDRDFNNLMAQKGKEIIADKAFEKQQLEADFQGTRLVFEWNDGEAEFELQFVNPQGKYFKAEHSMFANADEIQQEKQIGYSCKEFLMDDTLPGEWQINAKYLGNRKMTASYLKATIYYDYGLETQRKESKVFKLGLKNVNQELFKLNISSNLTSN